jgi:beta-galactosidase
MAYTTKNQKLALVYGDLTLGVHGSDFDYIFSYQTGGLESLVRGKKEWLYRSPRPTFWRATTDNDRGNGFPYRSGMWLAADQFVRFADVSVAIDNQEIPLPTAPENNRFCENETADCVQLTYTYETITVPSTE